MSFFLPDGPDDRLPVSILTGFLGSGKTTLLNRLLHHRDMARTAVVINEYGDIALDQLFVEKTDGDVTVLANGCLCCDVRGDLEGVIGTLFAKRESGEVPSFDRMVLETTGLADPAPIMQMLLNQPLVADNFRLDAVVTTVDALHILRQLREQPEAFKQVALADRLVITKTDLAEAAQVAAVLAELDRLNPLAPVLRVTEGVAPADLFGIDHTATKEVRFVDKPAHAHLHDISSFSLAFEGPVDWRDFSQWLTAFKIRHADQLLRVKGIVNVEGEDGPVAVHGVHHVFHAPVRLERWPTDDRRSRIVFITRGLPRVAVESDWLKHFDSLNGREVFAQ